MQNEREPTPSKTVKVIADLLESGAVAVVVTVVSGSNSGSKLVIEASGKATGTLGDSQLDALVISHLSQFLNWRDETRMADVKEFAPDFVSDVPTVLLFERIEPSPRLVICGAGHVGAALAKLAGFLGYHTTLIDDRAEFLEQQRFPDQQIHLVLATDWRTSVRQAIGDGKNIAVAVVTRGHNEDEACMHEVMRTNPDYVGMIGSKRRTTIVIDRLREAGVTDDQLQKIRAPIGLDIGAVSPEEVALAILAEIVAERRGRHGGSLSAWRRVSDKL